MKMKFPTLLILIPLTLLRYYYLRVNPILEADLVNLRSSQYIQLLSGIEEWEVKGKLILKKGRYATLSKDKLVITIKEDTKVDYVMEGKLEIGGENTGKTPLSPSLISYDIDFITPIVVKGKKKEKLSRLDSDDRNEVGDEVANYIAYLLSKELLKSHVNEVKNIESEEAKVDKIEQKEEKIVNKGEGVNKERQIIINQSIEYVGGRLSKGSNLVLNKTTIELVEDASIIIFTGFHGINLELGKTKITNEINEDRKIVTNIDKLVIMGDINQSDNSIDIDEITIDNLNIDVTEGKNEYLLNNGSYENNIGRIVIDELGDISLEVIGRFVFDEFQIETDILNGSGSQLILDMELGVDKEVMEYNMKLTEAIDIEADKIKIPNKSELELSNAELRIEPFMWSNIESIELITEKIKTVSSKIIYGNNNKLLKITPLGEVEVDLEKNLVVNKVSDSEINYSIAGEYPKLLIEYMEKMSEIDIKEKIRVERLEREVLLNNVKVDIEEKDSILKGNLEFELDNDNPDILKDLGEIELGRTKIGFITDKLGELKVENLVTNVLIDRDIIKEVVEEIGISSKKIDISPQVGIVMEGIEDKATYIRDDGIHIILGIVANVDAKTQTKFLSEGLEFTFDLEDIYDNKSDGAIEGELEIGARYDSNTSKFYIVPRFKVDSVKFDSLEEWLENSIASSDISREVEERIILNEIELPIDIGSQEYIEDLDFKVSVIRIRNREVELHIEGK